MALRDDVVKDLELKSEVKSETIEGRRARPIPLRSGDVVMCSSLTSLFERVIEQKRSSRRPPPLLLSSHPSESSKLPSYTQKPLPQRGLHIHIQYETVGKESTLEPPTPPFTLHYERYSICQRP